MKGGRRGGPGGTAPAYLFLSPEPFLLMESEAELTESLLPPENRPMNLFVLYGWEAALPAVEDFLQTMPFFGGRRLLVLREFAEFGEWKGLVPYLRDPNPSSCLLLTSSLLRPKDLQGKYKALSGLVEVEELRKPAGKGLVEWVRRRFSSRGKDVSEEVARLLVEYAGTDMFTLAQEIDKAALYTGDERRVGEGDISALMPGGAEGNIFAFLDCAGKRDLPGSLRILRALLADGAAPEYLVHMTARHFRQLLRGKVLTGEGRKGRDAARELGIAWPNLQEKFASQLAAWAGRDLIQALNRISACDLALKRGRVPADVVLDSFLVDLLAGC